MSGSGGHGGTRLAWFGGTVIVIALLQFLEHGLGVFNLRPWPLWLITLITVLAAALLSGYQEFRTQRKAIDEVEGSLDVMLACFPPRGANGLDPYDVGVHPTLKAAGAAQPYVDRDADEKIDSAISDDGLVVVFGPRRAGKSRSAFEAVKRVDGDAPMIVPEDAEGLATFLRGIESLPLLKHGPAVLWLDGLERFLDGLDVDPIDARLNPASPSLGWFRRAAATVRRTVAQWPAKVWAAVRRRKYEAPVPASLKVVATMRESELRRVLAEDSDAGHRLRRLLAHARGIRLEARLSPDESERFRPGAGNATTTMTVSDAVRSAWQQGWQPAAERPSLSTKRRRGPHAIPLILGGVLLLALLGVLGGLAAWGGGLVKPPSLQAQIHALWRGLRPCQTPAEFPKNGKGIAQEDDPTGKVLVTIADGGGCPMSDEVRFYRREHERLTEIASLQLPEGPRHTFSCIGVGADPCHVRLVGSQQVIAGAFRDSQTEQEFPLTVSFAHDQMSVVPLGPPVDPPRSIRPEIRRLDKKVVTLRLRVKGSTPRLARPAPGASCGPVEDCRLRGLAAEALAVLPNLPNVHPPVLAAAYVADGATDAPTRLAVRAWRIDATKEPPRAQPHRDCIILRKGRPLPRIAAVRASDPRRTVISVLRPPGSRLLC